MSWACPTSSANCYQLCLAGRKGGPSTARQRLNALHQTGRCGSALRTLVVMLRRTSPASGGDVDRPDPDLSVLKTDLLIDEHICDIEDVLEAERPRRVDLLHQEVRRILERG